MGACGGRTTSLREGRRAKESLWKRSSEGRAGEGQQRGEEYPGRASVTARVKGDRMGSSRQTLRASLVFSAGSPHMTHGRSSVNTWANQCRRERTVIGDNSVAVGSEGEGGDGGEGVEDEGRVWRSQ